MAALTWRNVDAPSFSGPNELWKASAANFNNALGMLDAGIGGFQDARTTRDSNALAMDIMKYQDPDALKAALSAGTIMQGVDPRYINPAALDFANNQQQKLVANEQAGVNLDGSRVINDARSFNLGRDKVIAGQQDAIEAARPEANRIIAEAKDMALRGDREGSRKFLGENVDMLSKAGYTGEGINNQIDTISKDFNQTLADRERSREHQEFFRKAGNIDRYRTTMADIIKSNDSPEFAIADVQKKIKDGTINSDVGTLVLSDLQSNGAKYFRGPDPEDKILMDAGIDPNSLKAQPDIVQQTLDAAEAKPDKYNPTETVPGNIAYNNQGAKRKYRLTPENEQAFGTLTDLGIEVDVRSGGQDASGPNRTSSKTTNHNEGNAGDVFLKKDGRKLSWDNQADKPLIIAALTRLKANGITSVGHGPGYMDKDEWHFGRGPERVWGEDETKNTAPQWLKDLWSSLPGPDGQVPASPVDMKGQRPGDPTLTLEDIARNPAVVNNPVVAPTGNIIDPAANRLSSWWDAVAGPSDDPATITPPEAKADTPLTDGAAEKLLADRAASDTPTDNTVINPEDVPKSTANVDPFKTDMTPAEYKTLLENATKDISTTSKLSANLNQNIAIDKNILNPEFNGQNRETIMQGYKKKYPDLNVSNFSDAVKVIEDTTGANSAVAAMVAANAIEPKNMDGWIWDSDDYGTATEGVMANRVNIQKAINNLAPYVQKDAKSGKYTFDEGRARQNIKDANNSVPAKAEQAVQAITALKSQLAAVERQLALNPNDADAAMRKLKLEQAVFIMEQQLAKTARDPAITAPSNALTKY